MDRVSNATATPSGPSVTGDTNLSSGLIDIITSTVGLQKGAFVTISGGFPDTAERFEILILNANDLTVRGSATSSVVGVTVDQVGGNYTDGTPGAVARTILESEFQNNLLEEIVRTIEKLGGTLDDERSQSMVEAMIGFFISLANAHTISGAWIHNGTIRHNNILTQDGDLLFTRDGKLRLTLDSTTIGGNVTQKNQILRAGFIEVTTIAALTNIKIGKLDFVPVDDQPWVIEVAGSFKWSTESTRRQFFLNTTFEYGSGEALFGFLNFSLPNALVGSAGAQPVTDLDGTVYKIVQPGPEEEKTFDADDFTIFNMHIKNGDIFIRNHNTNAGTPALANVKIFVRISNPGVAVIS